MIAEDLAALAVSTDSLGLLPGNPRVGDVEAVATSLVAFGQRKPIVARRGDRVVVAGNHTLQAARELGWSEIAVVWVDDDEATSKAFALADNRTAELGGYDEQALAELIGEVQAAEGGLLDATGWSDSDLADLLAKLEQQAGAEPDPEDDEAPVSAPALTDRGDVWLLGPHRVVCGDATVPADVEALMDGGLADVVWTDPPYGVSYVGKTADALEIENDRLDEAALQALLRAAVGNGLAACRPGAAWYVASPSGAQLADFGVVLAEFGLIRETIAWVKDVFVLGRQDYHWRHETIWYGWKDGAAHRYNGGRSQDTVWEVPRPRRSREHPTMKPVELIARALRNSSAPGETVLDLFAGSGSTLIAAHRSGRVARLLELDPRYVDVICRRWQERSGDEPVRAATGEAVDFTGEA